MSAASDDAIAARVAYLRRQRARARWADRLGLPLMLLLFVAFAPRIGAWILLPLAPLVLIHQYVQFRAYTQLCPRCGQPLTLTRWGAYRTVPPACPSCGLRITGR